VTSNLWDLLTEVAFMKILLCGMHVPMNKTNKSVNLRILERPCKIYIICNFAYFIIAEPDLT